MGVLADDFPDVALVPDAPLWCLARTTGVSGEAVVPRTWAFRPAPAQSRFAWQYGKDPDLSALD